MTHHFKYLSLVLTLGQRDVFAGGPDTDSGVHGGVLGYQTTVGLWFESISEEREFAETFYCFL